MKNVGSRLVLGVLVASMFASSGFAGREPKSDIGVYEEKMGVEAGEKKPFTFTSGDSVLTIGGKSVTEHRFAKNAVMLNDCLPDEFGHFRQTLDATANFAYGEKKFGHKAIELEAITRFKTVWGKIGYMAGVDENQEFKVIGAPLGEHTHAASRSLMWIKDAWLKASLNAILSGVRGEDSLESDCIHTVQLGMFTFILGRGISLGYIYGLAKDFLAIYNRDTDYSPPGILLSGELMKDRLSYDLYYAKLEEKSASFGDVFNSNKEKVLGRRYTPWSGPGKDSDLIAARLRAKVLKKKTGDLDIEPYIMYNEASDQKVELLADSKSMLGTAGMAAEYKWKNFEIGGEVAFNFGKEKLYAIDRNAIILKSDKYGTETVESVHEVYSKVTYYETGNTAYHGKNVVVNATTESALSCGCRQFEGLNNFVWAPSPADPNAIPYYKNACDRYRPAYENKYRGWMAVVDASYLFEDANITLAAAYGYASGDRHPHADECNKNYEGFVGLHEVYAGKRVPSVFILDARKIKRPLTMLEGTGEADSDPSFTDMHYAGIGGTWTHTFFKKYKVSINPNLLLFWKDHQSYKYDRTLNDCAGGVSCDYARRFLGTEFNVITRKELLKDLSVIGSFAVFVPGGYYKDIKGAPMKGDLFNKLEETDRADLPSSRYRIGDDVAFYSQIAVEYKF